MEIINRKIKDLTPADYNPRKLSDKQFNDLKKSIKTFGEMEPAIVNMHKTRENVIVSGHQRLKVAESLGYGEWPCIEVELTLKKEKELNVRMNKNTGDWDMDMLANHFETPDLIEWGFDDLEFMDTTDEEGLTDEDDVPEPPVEPTTKLGDLYQLGDHRLLCGDSTNIQHVERLMDGEKAEMCVTDPPYNVSYEGKTKESLKIKNDEMDDDTFYQFLYDAHISMFSAVNEGGALYVFHADSEGLNFRKAFKKSGFLLKQCCIWVKNSMVMGRQDFHWQHEPCLYGWKEGAAHRWKTDRKQTTIWEFDRPTRNREHPTMKPVPLIEYPIKCSSTRGDIVLDLFGGSGSTLIACEKTNRKARLMELDPKYCDVIVKRWEEFTGNKAEFITV